MPTVVTSGVWTDIIPTPLGLEGSGTPHLRWGEPVGSDRKSGYRFEGRPAAEVPLDGTEFTLGTFTHENFPITGMDEYSTVRLRVDVAFDDNTLAQSFDFDFRHNETPNEGPSPADEVDLPKLYSSEQVVVDGKEYVLVIKGFLQDGRTVRKLVSAEDSSNAADLVAKLVPAADIQTQGFKVDSANGVAFGEGRFAYIGPQCPVDIAYVRGGPSPVDLLEFEYSDALVGTLRIGELHSLDFSCGQDGACRFWFSAFALADTTGISAGVARRDGPGPVTTHRSGDRDESCTGRKVQCPEPLPRPPGNKRPPGNDPGHKGRVKPPPVPCLSPEEVDAILAKEKQVCEQECDQRVKQAKAAAEPIGQLTQVGQPPVGAFIGTWTYRDFNDNPDVDAKADDVMSASVWSLTLNRSGEDKVSGRISLRADYEYDVAGRVQSGGTSGRPTISFRSTGIEGTKTAGRIFDYVGHLAHEWAEAANQRPVILGNQIRAAVSNPTVSSFICVKRT